MSGHNCGCSTMSCGCCGGIAKATPIEIENQPGLDQLVYRAGRHGDFLKSMKARLSTMTVDAPGADGQTIETFRPLEGFTTRLVTDPSIALLDGWASVGDVLTFYQERTANEGYLRTATERRSVLELARLAGYTLRPGVAATAFLAYTIDDNQAEPVTVEPGSRSQSIPGPGEFPQFFETAEKIEARREWNNLKVRKQRPQNLDLTTMFGGAVTVETVWVAGTSTNLKTGDLLLFAYAEGKSSVLRRVSRVKPDFTAQRTAVHLFAYPGTTRALVTLSQFVRDATPIVKLTGKGEVLLRTAIRIGADVVSAQPSDPATWVKQMVSFADGIVPAELQTLLDSLKTGIATALAAAAAPARADDVALIESLLLPQNEQKRSSQSLPRSLSAAFDSGADNNVQLLTGFAPALKRTYFGAWANANLGGAAAQLTGVYALRASATLFGATVQKQATFSNNILDPPSNWLEWQLDSTESKNAAYLDQAYDAILPGSYVVVETRSFGDTRRRVLQVAATSTGSRTAYGFSGKSTRLTFSDEWWDANGKTDMSVLRSAQVLAQSEALTLVEEPILSDVEGQDIELAQLYEGLMSGRWIILSGERSDIDGTSGVPGVELHMVSGLRNVADPKIPGDKQHTTLLLATPMAFRYKRDTLTIYGNVAKATHGETRNETLGSGNGAQALQTFTLKQPPLTFVSAATMTGINSTLSVYVNNVRWHEQSTLADTNAQDRFFITKTDDRAVTSIKFGNGREGARLPTGVENIRAVYRNGIGKAGNVLAGQVSLVQTGPLGAKSVINPLRASGGADAETRDQARENVPLAVMALDRLVSMQDYEDFTRTFAGIGKAKVAKLTDGRREFLHLTIAGADDVPIDTTSDLYRNLGAALRRYGDPELPVQIAVRELVALVLSANVRIGVDYLWEPVSDAIRSALLEKFSFGKRRLGQPALRCEVVATMQAIEGVVYVDIDSFGGVADQVTAKCSETQLPVRRLRTPDELSPAIRSIASPAVSALGLKLKKDPGGVEAKLARVDKSGLILPAQLAIFSPLVPDTLILNQIS